MATPQPNNGYFDMAGISEVQQHYLLDMKNSYPNVNNAATVATYVNNLQNQLQGLSQSYVDANTSGAAVLDQQNQMIGIVNAEQQRLQEKQYLMDQTKTQQDRVALLNNSYRLRYVQYSKIMIVLIVGLCIHIVLRWIEGYFSMVPTLALVLLHIANVAVCLIIITYIYADIQSRDQINFNQIVLPPPVLIGSPSVSSTPNSGSFWGDFGICYGQTCCGPNTVWNANTGTCDVVAVPMPAQGTPSSTVTVPTVTVPTVTVPTVTVPTVPTVTVPTVPTMSVPPMPTIAAQTSKPAPSTLHVVTTPGPSPLVTKAPVTTPGPSPLVTKASVTTPGPSTLMKEGTKAPVTTPAPGKELFTTFEQLQPYTLKKTKASSAFKPLSNVLLPKFSTISTDTLSYHENLPYSFIH